MDPMEEKYFTGATCSSQDYIWKTKNLRNAHLKPRLAVQVLLKSLDIVDPKRAQFRPAPNTLKGLPKR